MKFATWTATLEVRVFAVAILPHLAARSSGNTQEFQLSHRESPVLLLRKRPEHVPPEARRELSIMVVQVNRLLAYVTADWRLIAQLSPPETLVELRGLQQSTTCAKLLDLRVWLCCQLATRRFVDGLAASEAVSALLQSSSR